MTPKFKVGDLVYYENYDGQILFLAIIIHIKTVVNHYLRLVPLHKDYNQLFIGKIGIANERFLRHIDD